MPPETTGSSSLDATRGASATPASREPGTRWRSAALRAVIAVQAIAAAVWLGYQLWRLLSAAPPIWPGGQRGAVDLELLRFWGTRWFEGVDAYVAEGAAPYPRSTYPPASYVLLWPLWGWLGFAPARALTAIVSLAGLAVLARSVARELGATTRLERAATLLVPLAIYPVGAAIGNGQPLLLLVPLLVTATLWLHREPAGSWRRRVAWLLVLVALAKPSVTAPFFWIVLAAPGGLANGALVVAGYLGVTGFAGLFQSAPLGVLLAHWAARVADISARASVQYSHGNLHAWMVAWGVEDAYAATAAAVLLALGVWVARHRLRDPWLQLGVVGLVTRLMAYHGWYDDLVLLPAWVALVRALRDASTPPRLRPAIGLLSVLLWGFLLAPGGQYLLSAPLARIWTQAQVAVWIATLAVLLARAAAAGESSPGRRPGVDSLEPGPG